MQQDEFTTAYASYRWKNGKTENQRGLACASLSLVTAARLSARRARLPILGCAAELRMELARLGREPVESVNRARQLEAARPWASAGRMEKGWAPWASTAGPPLMVGERLPRATELLHMLIYIYIYIYVYMCVFFKAGLSYAYAGISHDILACPNIW